MMSLMYGLTVGSDLENSRSVFEVVKKTEQLVVMLIAMLTLWKNVYYLESFYEGTCECFFGRSEKYFKHFVFVQEERRAGLVLAEGKILLSKKSEY